MDGKIDAFYGAEVVDDSGQAIGTLPHKTVVAVLEAFGKLANRDGEWVKVDAAAVAGWVQASQVQAPYHGGKRPGAGRPPVSDEGLLRVTITMSPSHFDVAQKLGDGKVSAGVRIMADNWLSYNPPLVKRVELWQHRTAGERYVVLVEGGVCVDACGPLNQADVDYIIGGGEDINWDALLSDDIAEHDEEYRRFWPEASA